MSELKPYAVRIRTAAQLLDVSQRTIYNMLDRPNRSGLEVVKVLGCTRITLESIERFIQQQRETAA
jgi:transposase